jgi:branched-chain amino acid transport system substrate-binding protein
MIMIALSGTVGITYGKQWEEMKIPAASVGINVMAQADSFITSTGGLGNYEMTLNVYARDVALTAKTATFMDAFIEEMGETPTYNAGTYDAMYILKEAIERADSVDQDDIVVELEKTDYIGTGGRFVFSSKHDVTWGPGYVTGVGVQWQDGQLKGVWPPSDGSWQGVQYGGIVAYKLPPWVVDYWT